MRFLAALFATLVFAACGTAPVTAARKPSTDAVVEFLLTAAVNDFQTNFRASPVRVRDVRIGHTMASDGTERCMLCGEFLPIQDGGKPGWTPFATIKTSGYEQWVGDQATSFCQRSSVIWDKEGDLSDALQRRLDAPR